MKNNSDHHERNTRGEKSRSVILAAAVEVFSELGPDATTLRNVARRSGVNIATLMYYFPDKESLFNEVIAATDNSEMRIVASWRDTLSDEDLSDIEKLKEVLTDLSIKIIDRVIKDPSRFRLGVYTALDTSPLAGPVVAGKGNEDISISNGSRVESEAAFVSISPEHNVVREVLHRALEIGTLQCSTEELEDYIEGFTHLTRGYTIAHIKEIALNSTKRDEIVPRFRKMVTRYVNNMLPYGG